MIQSQGIHFYMFRINTGYRNPRWVTYISNNSNSSLEGLRNSHSVRIQFKQTYESKYKVVMPFK